jgi:hypothetical protein
MVDPHPSQRPRPTRRGLSTAFALALAAAAFACSTPQIEGRTTGGAGGDPGAGGGGPPGGRGTGETSAGGAGGAGGGPVLSIDATPVGQPAPDAGPAGPPMTCGSESHMAVMAPLDLLLLVDTSGSMGEGAGTETKWTMTRAALTAFWRDTRSAGLGLGLQFFPFQGADRTCAADGECGPGVVTPGTCGDKGACAGGGKPIAELRACDPDGLVDDCPTGTTCAVVGRCSGSGGGCAPTGMPCPGGGGMCMPRQSICRNIGTGSCLAADYQKPAVPIAVLPASETMLTSTLMAKEPVGHTPTAPALTGALDHLRAHLAANPDHKGALIILTDGLPLGCTGNLGSITGIIGAAHMGTPSISTYAIGVFGSGQAATAKITLDSWARAGGTTESVVLTPTEALTRRFLDTLNQIRGAALACEFGIPAPQMGSLDHGKVNVRTTVAGMQRELVYVGNAGRCDPATGGWHYDVDPASGKPSRVLMCPASCNAVQMNAGARVDLVFGCATRVVD